MRATSSDLPDSRPGNDEIQLDLFGDYASNVALYPRFHEYDAPAPPAADVGIAMGTGTDIAMESAGLTLVKGDLRGIVWAIRLGRAMMRNIRQNLFFAFIYNALGVPIAAGALYPVFQIQLSPIIAGAGMSLSSVSVIPNVLRLRATKL